MEILFLLLHATSNAKLKECMQQEKKDRRRISNIYIFIVFIIRLAMCFTPVIILFTPFYPFVWAWNHAYTGGKVLGCKALGREMHSMHYTKLDWITYNATFGVAGAVYWKSRHTLPFDFLDTMMDAKPSKYGMFEKDGVDKVKSFAHHRLKHEHPGVTS